MRQEDIICLNIYGVIREYFETLKAEACEYENIIGVFFHELMIYSTSIYLNQHHDKPINDSQFLIRSILQLLDENLNYKRPGKILSGKNILSILTKFVASDNRYAVADPKISAIKTKTLLGILSNYRPNTETNTKVFIKNKKFQLNILRELLLELADLINFKDKDIFTDLFYKRIRDVFLTNKEIPVGSPILITGSNAVTSTRIISSRYKSQGSTVISLSHSFSTFTAFDEPVVGYGELSYCDYYIDVGNYKFDKARSSFIKPLHKTPNILLGSSNTIKKLYKNKFIEHERITKKSTILYVPTSFSGILRYGPFRDCSDELYLKWQLSLLETFPNLAYKIHPHSKEREFLQDRKIIRKNLLFCLNDFDFFITDYLSSAHAILAATDKQVIFFNLGLRNYCQYGLDLLRERFFWVDIDMQKNFIDQINASLDQFNQRTKGFNNNYTENFSINPSQENNKDKILKWILNKKFNQELNHINNNERTG